MTTGTHEGQHDERVEELPPLVWRNAVWVVSVGRLLSIRLTVRHLVVVALLLAAAVFCGLLGLSIGEIQVSLVDVVRTLLGTTDPVLEKVVGEWRLPRVLLGLLFGAALGASGAIFQSLTRNPLGSPDVIGFDAGAYTGAVVSIIVLHTNGYVVPGALLGGVTTAVLVYLLAYKRGIQGFRLIVVGIAITAMLGSLNGWMILKADLWAAKMAAVWGAGSLNGLGWAELRSGALVISVAAVVLILLARRMRALDLGDDAARAMGVHVESTRLGLIVAAVSLTSVVTALAGPITFVALVAPQLARILTRAPGVQVLPAACMGAMVLTGCDVVALNAFAPTILPVGLLTVVLGGCYLVWLLIAQSRKELR